MTRLSSNNERNSRRLGRLAFCARAQKATVLLCIPALWLGACSLQNFDYLKEGPADDGSGGSDSSGGRHSSGSGGFGTNMGGASGGKDAGGDGDGTMGGMGGDVSTSNPQLENGSFETGNFLGWSVSPASAIDKRYVFVQVPTGSVPAPDGIYELAFWHGTDSYDVTVSQKLTGLADGTYTLDGYFSRGVHLTVYLFARGCSDEDPEPIEILPTDASSFAFYQLQGIEVRGGSCEVGLSVSAGPTDWLNADMLSLNKE